MSESAPQPPRRIVCAYDEAGDAIFAVDEPAAPVGHTEASVWQIWAADGEPEIGEAAPAHGADFFPPPSGSRVYMSEMPVDPRPVDPAVGMHATDTIDFAIVVSGSVRLFQGDGTDTMLHQGDVVVQAGTEHAWENPGPEPARVVFVLLGAER